MGNYDAVGRGRADVGNCVRERRLAWGRQVFWPVNLDLQIRAGRDAALTQKDDGIDIGCQFISNNNLELIDFVRVQTFCHRHRTHDSTVKLHRQWDVICREVKRPIHINEYVCNEIF